MTMRIAGVTITCNGVACHAWRTIVAPPGAKELTEQQARIAVALDGWSATAVRESDNWIMLRDFCPRCTMNRAADDAERRALDAWPYKAAAPVTVRTEPTEPLTTEAACDCVYVPPESRPCRKCRRREGL
jgi:hypothetical protein